MGIEHIFDDTPFVDAMHEPVYRRGSSRPAP